MEDSIAFLADDLKKSNCRLISSPLSQIKLSSKTFIHVFDRNWKIHKKKSLYKNCISLIKISADVEANLKVFRLPSYKFFSFILLKALFTWFMERDNYLGIIVY